MNGICYDKAFKPGYSSNLSYNDLNEVFSFVYPNSEEDRPFELIGFGACMTASYELANSVANFSHYMVGSEPTSYGWYLTDFFAALAKDPSINGAQLGKVICNSNMKNYAKPLQNIQTFSVIDLTKMEKLREANEEFFSKALKLSDESNGFSGAFARAVYAKNSDNYSNLYTDLGLLAKNTKDLMPKESKNLKKAINNAVVYKKRGAYLNATGISTAYPYISDEAANISENYLESFFLTQDSMPSAQKDFYRKLIALKTSNLQNFELSWDKNWHVVAELEPEQLENVLRVRAMMFQPNDDTSVELWISDDINIDRKKGIVKENIRPVYYTIDGHRITMELTYEGRGYKFYEVPIILKSSDKREPESCLLQVCYDISKKEYSILGISNKIDNGMVLETGYILSGGDIITPLFPTLGTSEDSKNSQADDLFKYSYIETYQETDPKTGKPVIKERVVNNTLKGAIKPAGGNNLFFKVTAGESFVYSKDSKIIEKKVSNGDYMGIFCFIAPNGSSSNSLPFEISVKHGEIFRDVLDESDLK